MKKVLIFLLPLLFVSLVIGSSFQNVVVAEIPSKPLSEWTTSEIDNYLRGLGIETANVNGLRLNYDIVRQKGVLVYGGPSNVSGNQQKSGEWRFLGQTITGTKFMNIDFPEDASGNNNVGTRNWIYRPWVLPESMINNHVKPKETTWMNKSVYGDQHSKWLDTIVDKYTYQTTKNPNEHGNWLPKYPGNVLKDYAIIESPPTDYGPGIATLYHRTFYSSGSQHCSGGTCWTPMYDPNTGKYYKDWYDTFLLAPLKWSPFDGISPPPPEPPPTGADSVIGETCYITQTFDEGISGTYTYKAPPCWKTKSGARKCTTYTGYYYESLTMSIEGPHPSTVKAGQGTELIVKTNYSNDNPAHQGRAYAPRTIRLTAPNSDDWPYYYMETIDMVPDVPNPAYDWGTVTWRIPYAHFDAEGNWTRHETKPYIGENEFGGLQRWYFGFDVPDGVQFILRATGSAGYTSLDVCDHHYVRIQGSPYDEFIIRTIDPHNPFPTGDVGINWQGKEHLITDLTDWYDAPNKE